MWVLRYRRRWDLAPVLSEPFDTEQEARDFVPTLEFFGWDVLDVLPCGPDGRPHVCAVSPSKCCQPDCSVCGAGA